MSENKTFSQSLHEAFNLVRQHKKSSLAASLAALAAAGGLAFVSYHSSQEKLGATDAIADRLYTLTRRPVSPQALNAAGPFLFTNAVTGQKGAFSVIGGDPQDSGCYTIDAWGGGVFGREAEWAPPDKNNRVARLTKTMIVCPAKL